MKQRLLLLSLLFCFAATAMWAQAATKRLVLWQKSGEKVYFDLNDMPETTFENGLFVKARATRVSACCPLSAASACRRKAMRSR